MSNTHENKIILFILLFYEGYFFYGFLFVFKSDLHHVHPRFKTIQIDYTTVLFAY